jgi:hypothetical protein
MRHLAACGHSVLTADQLSITQTKSVFLSDPMFKRKPKRSPSSYLYECEACGLTENVDAEVIDYFDEIDPGLPGQPPTFQCQRCPGIMYPQMYLRAKRAEPKAS